MSPGHSRHLISGLRASVPVPEQGASTRILSNRRAKGSLRSASSSTGLIPSLPRLRNVLRRPKCRSPATTGAISASNLALPPGAAQTSSTQLPGRTASSVATRWELMSWTRIAPPDARCAQDADPEVSA